MKPIRKDNNPQRSQYQHRHLQPLRKLQTLLACNHKTQDKLKKIRDSIVHRINDLQDFIGTHQLRKEYPPPSGIISYLKFDRNTPFALQEQSRVIEQQQAIKNTNEKDCEFMNKLSKGKKPPRNKKEISLLPLPSNPKHIDFAEVAIMSGYKDGIELYRTWLEENTKKKMVKTPFLLNEDKMIIQKQKKYGDNWEKICQFIDSRTFEQVYYQFHNRINPKLSSGRWSLRLSLMLIILCEHYGVKRWAFISQKIIVKSQLQVRQRYCNIIDPSIGRNHWTTDLQERLIELAPEMRYCWKDIAKLPIFKDKTDNCIWRKYRNLMIAKTRQQIELLMPGGQRKGLIEKILNFKQKMQSKRKVNVFRTYLVERRLAAKEEPSPRTSINALNGQMKVEAPISQIKMKELSQEEEQDSLRYIVYND